jgi:glycosyltransferase involved in cell wall biosynthesis
MTGGGTQVVHVAGFYPPHLGGAERVVERLARLQAQTRRVTVHTSAAGGGPPAERDCDGRLRVVRHRTWVVAHTPVAPGMLAALLRNRPVPGVLHVHTGQALIPEIGRLASRLRGVPYVAHVHLLVRPSSAAGRLLLPVYDRMLFGPFLRRARRVICLTGAMRDEVVTRYRLPRERVRIVPNGVDLSRPVPAPDARAARELLFVGRLVEQKNVLAVVDAMSELPPDLTLRIVGEGELAPRIRARIRELGLPNVRLEGRMDPAGLAAAYRRATALLMPSSHEGMPLVLLEALAAGVPVVCSRIPELVEVGGDAVLTVDPVTPRTLAAAVRDLLADDPRRALLSAKARERSAGYDWSAVARSVDAVYAEVRSGW